MRLDGRRESSNVEDRRGMSGGAKAGIGGIGAIVIAALFAWMSGGDPLSALIARRSLLLLRMCGLLSLNRWVVPIHRQHLCCSLIR